MEYADFPYHDEISKTFNHIENNLGLDEATKLKEKVIIGLLSKYALRPSEIRSIRLCDVYSGNPAHVVITSEAVGQVKTANANRILLLKEDEFSTKENLLQLCHLRAGLASEACLFGDNVVGSTLDGSQLLFNIIHEALSKVTGCNVSIMSFRHFNVSRDVATVIENSGIDALKDRKVLSIIAAQSGHGHAKTSIQNYCCNLDQQRHKFWSKHLLHQKLGAPIEELKTRMGLYFKGNLPSNHPSFILLMQILRDRFPETHARLKNCQDFILKKSKNLVEPTAPHSRDFGACCKYLFYQSACIDSELSVFESSILEREKQIIDEGKSYLKDTLNKDWFDEAIFMFRPIIQTPEFLKIVKKLGVMPISDREAILIAQSIPALNSKWEIRNQNLLNLLERNSPVFFAANINVEIWINQNLEVHTRKLLRQKPFIQVSEKPLPRDVLCQVGFWDSNLKSSLRARRHQEVMVKLNLIFLTKAIYSLGELHG